MILVDSSIYVDWLRARVEFPRQLEPWVRRGELWTCGVINLEVLRGIRAAEQRERVAEFFNLLPQVRCDEAFWREAAELAWTLDRRGHVLPVSDLIIATAARAVEAGLITTEEHFAKVPGLGCRRSLPSPTA